MLIDEVEITVKAGDGGNGAATFRGGGRSKGGPDGGNGGDGGSIYFQGIDDPTALRQFQFKKILTANSGIPGQRSNLYGKNAADLIINVPLGTHVTNLENDKSFEIRNKEDKVLVASGGIGGRGNNSFKTATDQAPRFAEKGTKGQEKKLRLVLRIIADIGFVGFPNAGKSSILSKITNANPKIGDYPFTTLEPNLGILNKIVVADIPGIIKDASKGKGLGVSFLKHIQKTKLIVHCISLESDNLLEDFNTVNTELKEFDPTLSSKVKLIILTKKDLFTQSEIESKIKHLKKLDIKFITFSIFEENDIQYLIKEISRIYSE